MPISLCEALRVLEHSLVSLLSATRFEFSPEHPALSRVRFGSLVSGHELMNWSECSPFLDMLPPLLPSTLYMGFLRHSTFIRIKSVKNTDGNRVYSISILTSMSSGFFPPSSRKGLTSMSKAPVVLMLSSVFLVDFFTKLNLETLWP